MNRVRTTPPNVRLRAELPLFVSVRRVAHDLACAIRLRTDGGSWVLPGQVLACGYPRTDAALAGLAAAGIHLIVNLHRRPHPPDALARHGLVEVHLPTHAFTPPTLDALRKGVDVIEAAVGKGERVAVHCGGGRGRSGTLVACVLVARGEPADDAIARVRRLRPGSVETRGQVRAVRAFAELIGRR